MNYLNLTRDQAISLVGIETIEKLEKEHCNPTNKFINDILAEYKSSIKSNDGSATISAYYYIDSSIDNLDNAVWEIHHYAIY
ncbi:MAG TPA: hypothetical protein PKC44_06750 [Agitococcus sp.]|nr:hypothetical protein [Agitococcus sp.]